MTARRYRVIWWTLLGFSCVPAALLFSRLATGDLGPNPLQYLQQTSGLVAFVFLLLTLSITPLRRVSSWLAIRLHRRFGKRLEDWNWLLGAT